MRTNEIALVCASCHDCHSFDSSVEASNNVLFVPRETS